ncbi:uncharacterized protein LOC135693937 [Rhopilema esculentum]|uniref:uncharacterized protein LOC135693937 n=1 Tax=Rhopilema esculentum TaxID=499914 RepID=UPI0031DE617D
MELMWAAFIVLLTFGTNLACCGSVEVTLQPSLVQEGSNIIITVIQFSPDSNSSAFDRLDCGYKANGSDLMTILAQFDKYTKAFRKPSVGLSPDFDKRIHYTRNVSFVIKDVKIPDGNLGFLCKVDYEYQGRTHHIESSKHWIRTVYKPVSFVAYLTTTKTVFHIQSGEVVTIRCAVHSRPASDVIFDVSRRDVEHIISNRNITQSASFKSETIISRTIVLINLQRGHHPTIVSCRGKPKQGREVRKVYTVYIRDRKVLDKDNDDKNCESHWKWIAVGLMVLIGIIIIIAVGCCCYRKRK